MGRKRKVGSIPCPLLPSFSGHARPITPSAGSTTPAKKGSHTDQSPSTYKQSRKRARQQQERLAASTTAPTNASPSLSSSVAPLVSSAPPPFSSAVQPLLSPPLLPNNASSDHDATEKRISQTQPSTTNGSRSGSTAKAEATQQVSPRATTQAEPQATPRPIPPAKPKATPKATPRAAPPGMTPSAVLAQLLPATGWRLGSCWGSDCHCSAFRPPPSNTTAATVAKAETTTAPLLCSSCGHRSVAHELVDWGEAQHQHHHQQRQHQALSSHYRYSSGGSHAAAGATAQATGVRLRRLFSAIRNARAVGHCDLFEDSEGVRSWGAGWFLSRHARRYLQEARESAAELGGALHDPSAVAGCLAAADTLLSGNTARHWAMPASLPSASTYQALGTGIASELDLAYWHAHYTAASLFDAGGVTADTAASVIPPPEVYFVGLAYHVPSLAELRAFPGMTNPALRDMLSRVFDLPVDAVEELRAAGLRGDSGGEHMNDEISFPVLTNPLLAVTQSAWLETAISACVKSWVPHFPPQFGDSEGTMRGSDPALPAPIRTRCDPTRDWSARLFAFAVPNRQAIHACRRAVEACGGGQGGGGIIEVGAGLGYWKWVLEGAGGRGSKSSEGSRILSRDRLGEGASAATAAHRSLQGARFAVRAPDRTVVPRLRVLAVDKDPPKLPRSIEGEGRGGGRRKKRVLTVDKDALKLPGSIEGEGRGGGGGGRGRGKAGARRRRDQGGPLPVRSNEYHGGAPAWAAVEVGGPERLRSASASDYPVLLLCYPPPSTGGAGVGATPCMGADALGKFSGKVVLYVGEVGGDTGSPRLEAALQAGWNLVEDIDLPCNPTTANRLMVFTRKSGVFPHSTFQTGRESLADCQHHSKGSGTKNQATLGRPDTGSGERGAAFDSGGGWGPGFAMYRCSRCQAGGGKGVKLRRCRLTRAVTYCSGGCLSLDNEKWRANLEARHVFCLAGRAGTAPPEIDGSIFRDKKLFKRLASGSDSRCDSQRLI